MSSNNSLLFYKNQAWKKKNTDNYFDVTLGSFNGAENCDLVGLFILSQLADLNLKSGLYRDDGLAVSNKTKGKMKG